MEKFKVPIHSENIEEVIPDFWNIIRKYENDDREIVIFLYELLGDKADEIMDKAMEKYISGEMKYYTEIINYIVDLSPRPITKEDYVLLYACFVPFAYYLESMSSCLNRRLKKDYTLLMRFMRANRFVGRAILPAVLTFLTLYLLELRYSDEKAYYTAMTLLKNLVNKNLRLKEIWRWKNGMPR